MYAYIAVHNNNNHEKTTHPFNDDKCVKMFIHVVGIIHNVKVPAHYVVFQKKMFLFHFIKKKNHYVMMR